MKSAILTPILFSSGFFLIVDLLTWKAIKHLLRNKPKSWRYWAAGIHFGLLAILLGLFLYFFLSPQQQRYDQFRTFVSGFVMSFYLSKLIFSLFVLFESILKFFAWMFERYNKKKEKIVEKKGGMSRADFIYTTGAVTAAAPFYLMLQGVYKNAYNYKVRKVKLEIPGLPSAYKGKTIVQLSDIHSGSLADKDAVYQGIRQVKDLNPDLFFFTGDLVNNFAWEAKDFVEMFGEIKADMGTYSILGNHDYGLYHRWESKEAMHANFNDLVNTHKEIGWNLLRNEHEVLTYKGQKLALIGVENWGHSMRFPKLGDVDKAQAGMEDVKTKLLLSHDPSHWDHVVRQKYPDMNVMFSGHTHGAQIGIENALFKWSPVQYMYKQWAGLYEEGQQQLYVNRGFGFIGYPGRVGIMPEITLFELA